MPTMDYPTLIEKYLGARTPQQLQNDIKNLTSFAARGGNPEELLKNTRAKIFGETTSRLQSGLSALQQKPQVNPVIQGQLENLTRYEETLGVPEARTASEQALGTFQQLSKEATLAPSAAQSIFREKIPYLTRSLPDMLNEIMTNPNAPVSDFGAALGIAKREAAQQKQTLDTLMNTVKDIYSVALESSRMASESRQKQFHDLKQQAWQMYNSFEDLQREIDKEQRELGIYAKKQAIEAQKEITVTAAKAGIGGIGKGGKEELNLYQTIQIRNQIEDNMRMNPAIQSFGELINFGVPEVMTQFEAGIADNVSDTVLMRTLAKVTDPSTGVREEEYRTFEDAIGALNRVYKTPSKWLGKGRLTNEGRTAMIREIKDRYNSRLKNYQNQYKYYQKQAENSGITIPPLYSVSETARLQAPNGDIYEYDSVNDADYQEDVQKGFKPM